jgi:hypothetical protein
MRTRHQQRLPPGRCPIASALHPWAILNPNPLHLHLLARRVLRLARETHLPRQRRVRIRIPGQAHIPILDPHCSRERLWRRHRIVLVCRDIQATVLVKVHCRVVVPARRDDGDGDIGRELIRELHRRGNFQATASTENVGQHSGGVNGVGLVRGGHVVVEGRVG